MYRIVEKENLAATIKRIKVEAPLVARKLNQEISLFSALMKLMKGSL